MRNIICLVSYSLMSISVLLVTQFSLVQSDAGLIAQTCKNTPHVDLCISSIKLNPSHRGTWDTATLASIIVDVIVVRSKAAVALIKKNPRSTGFPTCKQEYGFLLSDYLTEARQALPGNPKFAQDGVRYMGGAATSCLRQLPSSSPVAGLSEQVRELSDIGSAIIQTLL